MIEAKFFIYMKMKTIYLNLSYPPPFPCDIWWQKSKQKQQQKKQQTKNNSNNKQTHIPMQS